MDGTLAKDIQQASTRSIVTMDNRALQLKMSVHSISFSGKLNVSPTSKMLS